MEANFIETDVSVVRISVYAGPFILIPNFF